MANQGERGQRIGIAGSGVMGSGIAECAARHGHDVVLRSRSSTSADATMARLRHSLDRQVERDALTEDDRDAAVRRVRSTTDLQELADCDLVIETIVEDLEAKKGLFGELDAICTSAAVLATNTSTLPVIEMAMETERPQRVCGLHFFNPAPKMAVVEVVRPLSADDETVATARAFVESIGKVPVEVGDEAGFIVNALLFPYLNNAVRMLESGLATRDDIDTAMKGGCNFPMGPFALLDLIGLDISRAILGAMHASSGNDHLAPRPLLDRLVAEGNLGRKTGKGFYDYLL